MLSLKFLLLLILVTSLVLQVTSRTFYITPHSTNNSNTITLSQCVSDGDMCFTSNTNLIFFSGLHNLQKDFVLRDASNIAIDGNHSTIKCTSSVGLVILNVTNIFIQNIEILHCRKSYSAVYGHVPTYIDKPKLHWYAAIHMHYCVSVTVTNVSITVAIGTNGLVVVNAMLNSTLSNVLVVLYHKTPKSSSDIPAVSNGMVIYYFQSSNLLATTLYIQNFTYKKQALTMIQFYNIFCIVVFPTNY